MAGVMPADRLFHRRAGHSVKVNALTDFEFRVWWAYVMAADDFGILRYSPVELQSISDALAMKKPQVVLKAIDHLVKVDLVQTFDHQNQPYIYQWDWQDWQKVKWPSRTINPKPPSDRFSEETVWLFQVFPGGKQVPKKPRESSVEVPGKNFDGTFPRQQTYTANANADGSRLTANADLKEGGVGETPRLDLAFAAFKSAYPESRRAGGMAERLYFEAVNSGKVTPDAMLAALENHVASAQWQDARHIPNITKWLQEERWDARLPPPKPHGTTSKTAGNAEAARQFLRNHGVTF